MRSAVRHRFRCACVDLFTGRPNATLSRRGPSSAGLTAARWPPRQTQTRRERTAAGVTLVKFALKRASERGRVGLSAELGGPLLRTDQLRCGRERRPEERGAYGGSAAPRRLT
jgi:hypothetical protein